MSITEKNINTIGAVIDGNRYMSKMSLKALLHIPRTIIYHILTEKLQMVHVAYTWVPHILTSDQMWICVESASIFLGLIAEDLTYLNWGVTCDEIWVHHYARLAKQESEHWKTKNEPQNKKVRQQMWVDTDMLIVFFDHQGPLYQNFKLPKTTVNKEYYLEVSKILQQHVNMKSPKLKNGWILL